MSFNLIAPYYDRLARLVFGKHWTEIQLAPAPHLEECQKLLILGGGSGQILEHINPKVQITYLEASSEMLNMARNRHNSNVAYVHADFLQWNTSVKYDAVYCPFFLDCMSKDQLQKVLEKLQTLLMPGGMLHVLDFQPASSGKNAFVKLMYFFFGIVANLPGRALLPLRNHINSAGFYEQALKTYYNEWVFYGEYRISLDPGTQV